MKKIATLVLCLLFATACSGETKKEGGVVCSYGEKSDDIYVEVIISYNNEQYVKALTFTQFVKYKEEVGEEHLSQYATEMNAISGVNASASFEDGKVRYHYSVNLSEYDTASDLLGLINQSIMEDNGFMQQEKLVESLEKKEYDCKKS